MKLALCKGSKCDSHGFTLFEILVIVAVLVLFGGIYGTRLSQVRERAWITIDLNNIGQILRASALYNADHDDDMAHPTWGSGLTGPDGWAYRTSTANGPVPGTVFARPPSCEGRDINSKQYQDQLAFFRVGQVTRYLTDEKMAMCPKDVATRTGKNLRQLWLARPVKVTSYCWNGTIGGYVGPNVKQLNGKTYKVSQFLPTDWQMWEQIDSDAFYFNDAGINPENPGELLSGRHSGSELWYKLGGLTPRNLPGGGVVGTFGGSAKFVRWPHIYDLSRRRIPAPNEVLNGPGYRR